MTNVNEIKELNESPDKVEMSSDLTCAVIQACASDDFVIHTAKVSAQNSFGSLDILPETLDKARFIRALMSPRHGVPFEHNIFTFLVQVPIFVQNQWVKHRMSSMNSFSGRYSVMLPKFYTAPDIRPLINEGTKMKPKFVMASESEQEWVRSSDYEASQAAWDEYQLRLRMGIAEEYARTILPLNTYTQFYWSVNARSLMNFLERRIDDAYNRVETHPQWEIQFAARQLEEAFKFYMPLSHEAFINAGRVAP